MRPAQLNLNDYWISSMELRDNEVFAALFKGLEIEKPLYSNSLLNVLQYAYQNQIQIVNLDKVVSTLVTWILKK